MKINVTTNGAAVFFSFILSHPRLAYLSAITVVNVCYERETEVPHFISQLMEKLLADGVLGTS